MANATLRLKRDFVGPGFPAQRGPAVQKAGFLLRSSIGRRVARLAVVAPRGDFAVRRIEIRFVERQNGQLALCAGIRFRGRWSREFYQYCAHERQQQPSCNNQGDSSQAASVHGYGVICDSLTRTSLRSASLRLAAASPARRVRINRCRLESSNVLRLTESRSGSACLRRLRPAATSLAEKRSVWPGTSRKIGRAAVHRAARQQSSWRTVRRVKSAAQSVRRDAEYVLSAPTRIAAGARDLSRRNVSTAQTRPQNSKASFAHQHPCGLKSALRRSVARAATTLNTYDAEQSDQDGRAPLSRLHRWFRNPCSGLSGPVP